jgi:uncharacterized membrane protein required for colicin V production
MTLADIAVILGLGLFVFSGLFEGIIKKLFGLVVLIVAFYLAVRTYATFAEWLVASFSISTAIATIVSFLIIFLFALVTGNLLYRVGGRKNELFKVWDRLAGGVFGFVEGLIIISLLTHILLLADIPTEAARENSVVYPMVHDFAPYLFEKINIFVPHVRDFFEMFLNDIEIPE